MARTLQITAPLLAVALSAAAVGAHGGRVDFTRWGPLPRDTLGCQRGIARAAATCARDSWELTRACREAQGTGTPCDPMALTARIQNVRLAALDAADQACSERQAQDVGYLGLFDLQADLIDFCRAWTVAASSAVYAGAPPGDESPPCTAALAEATSRLLAFVFRQRRRCMETIAAKAIDAPRRELLLARTDAAIARFASGLAAGLATRCSPGQFNERYGRPAAELLATLARRADCLAGAAYIQDRIVCAAAVCGNGVLEPGEACDDGNTNDGDTCSADCAATAP